MSEVLNAILKAKEQRQSIRQKIGEEGYATVSLNFNIPGYPKSDDLITKAFLLVQEDLNRYLIAHRVKFKPPKKMLDAAGDIAFFPICVENIDYKTLKAHLEYFETQHPLGRLLDVDLFDANQQSISSNKQKACFICKDKSALFCMRNQTHSYQDLRKHIDKRIKKYLKKHQKEQVCKSLSSDALWAMLTEISLLGKPGLVSPDSTGSHTDMNYHTFLASGAAISPYFYQVAKKGYAWNGKNKDRILVDLRVMGLLMEQAMFEATKGVNTHKGAVFLMTYCLFVSAYVFKKDGFLNQKRFRKVLSKLNKGLVSKELSGVYCSDISHGEACFKTYGRSLAGGIRQEVEAGLPTVFESVFPFMKTMAFSVEDSTNQPYFQNQCRQVLLKIMSLNNDTNILYRSNQETLEELKARSLKALNQDEDTHQQHYLDLVDFCEHKRISPGGSADLLAVSLFLYKLDVEGFKAGTL